MPKSTRSTDKPPTLKALATALGVTVRRITALKSESMPTDSIEAAQEWRAARAGKAAGRADSSEELRQRRIALLRQQERRVRLDADRTAGTLIDKTTAEQVFHQIGHEVKAGLRMLEGELPPLLHGLDVPQIKRLLATRFDDVLLGLSEGRFESASNPG